MAENSPIVTLLSQRSEEELNAMRDKAEKLLEETKIELDLIEKALAVKSPTRKRRRSPRGNTKKRILAFIDQSAGPVGPAEVRDGLNATGDNIGSSAVYNQMGRLTDAGLLVKVDEGMYKLAPGAENGSPGGEKIEGTESQSRITDPHEGPND